MESMHLMWAVALGALSAVSLPLGAWLALQFRPSHMVSAILAAFGAGALIAALTLELVAPTVMTLHEPSGHGSATFWVLLVSALVGGVLFVVLDHLLATRGAYLRKLSTAITHFTTLDRRRDQQRVMELCAVPLLRELPVSEVAKLIHDVIEEHLKLGEVLFKQGEESDALYLVRSGQVQLDQNGSLVETVGAGAILGELPLLTGAPRGFTATAQGPLVVLELRRDCIDRWRGDNEAFDTGLRKIATAHLSEFRQREEVIGEAERRWGSEALAALSSGASVPTPQRMRAAAEEQESSGAGVAVWLGLLIDGVPESLVIGAGLFGLISAKLATGVDLSLGEVIPYTLLAGLFLSNVPEALSSSSAMRSQGFSKGRIHLMWLSLVVIVAIGSGVGFACGNHFSHTTLVAIEGLAAGAMLTTIASTMIPEAVHLSGSGSRVGLATLVGFFTAVSFKLLE